MIKFLAQKENSVVEFYLLMGNQINLKRNSNSNSGTFLLKKLYQYYLTFCQYTGITAMQTYIVLFLTEESYIVVNVSTHFLLASAICCFAQCLCVVLT